MSLNFLYHAFHGDNCCWLKWSYLKCFRCARISWNIQNIPNILSLNGALGAGIPNDPELQDSPYEIFIMETQSSHSSQLHKLKSDWVKVSDISMVAKSLAIFISSDRNSCSDDALLYIPPLFYFSIYANI